MLPNIKYMFNSTVCFTDSLPLNLEHFSVGEINMSRDGMMHVKTCPFTIVLQVIEGAYDIQCQGQNLRLEGEKTLVVPANVETKFVHLDGPGGVIHSSWFHLRYTMYRIIDFMTFFDIPLLLPETAYPGIRDLLSEAVVSGAPSYEPCLLARQHILGSRLLQILLEASSPQAETWQNFRKNRLFPVLHYIQENLGKKLDVDKLAKVASLSPSRFHLVFSSELGCGPMTYVRTRRLDAAARILVTRQNTLSEIAAQVGFGDAFHLSHAFKKHYGVSPREYLKQTDIPHKIDFLPKP